MRSRSVRQCQSCSWCEGAVWGTRSGEDRGVDRPGQSRIGSEKILDVESHSESQVWIVIGLDRRGDRKGTHFVQAQSYNPLKSAISAREVFLFLANCHTEVAAEAATEADTVLTGEMTCSWTNVI